MIPPIDPVNENQRIIPIKIGEENSHTFWFPKLGRCKNMYSNKLLDADVAFKLGGIVKVEYEPASGGRLDMDVAEGWNVVDERIPKGIGFFKGEYRYVHNTILPNIGNEFYILATIDDIDNSDHFRFKHNFECRNMYAEDFLQAREHLLTDGIVRVRYVGDRFVRMGTGVVKIIKVDVIDVRIPTETGDYFRKAHDDAAPKPLYKETASGLIIPNR